MSTYTPYLSKSRFIKGLQCHKALWLQTHRPELKAEISEQQQATFDTGTEVGQLAQQLFPGGVEVPYDGLSIAEQIERTQQLIESGVETIFEASFSFNDVFVKADILHRVGDSWQLGEVKSSTKVKEVYLNDVAVQYQVISGCGIRLESTGLVLIDTSYVRQGDIEPQKLFIWIDVSGEVLDRQQAIAVEITNQKSMLIGPEPCIDIGPHCSDPYECDFYDHCWAHIPENSVFDFRDHGKPDTFELYRQGILRMEDVPFESLGWRQQMQVEGLHSQDSVIDHEAIKEFLAEMKWPLSFLDFETTFMMAVPLFDGTSPYQSVPFQFSLHIQDSPGGTLQHEYFLSDDCNDPRPAFLKALLAAIPSDGDIVVWNRAFESKIINELAIAYPVYAPELYSLIDRMVDLMAPFRRREFYHGMMNGSYSIKAVLPALVPGFSYDDLDIASGDVAADSWLQMIMGRDSDERLQLHENLLKYCERDTEAMVRILEVMQATNTEKLA